LPPEPGVVIGRKSSGEVPGRIEPNGFRTKIPIRDYQTAKGIRLEGRGVKPDEPVELTMRDFVEDRNPDLERRWSPDERSSPQIDPRFQVSRGRCFDPPTASRKAKRFVSPALKG